MNVYFAQSIKCGYLHGTGLQPTLYKTYTGGAKYVADSPYCTLEQASRGKFLAYLIVLVFVSMIISRMLLSKQKDVDYNRYGSPVSYPVSKIDFFSFEAFMFVVGIVIGSGIITMLLMIFIAYFKHIAIFLGVVSIPIVIFLTMDKLQNRYRDYVNRKEEQATAKLKQREDKLKQIEEEIKRLRESDPYFASALQSLDQITTAL